MTTQSRTQNQHCHSHFSRGQEMLALGTRWLTTSVMVGTRGNPPRDTNPNPNPIPNPNPNPPRWIASTGLLCRSVIASSIHRGLTECKCSKVLEYYLKNIQVVKACVWGCCAATKTKPMCHYGKLSWQLSMATEDKLHIKPFLPSKHFILLVGSRLFVFKLRVMLIYFIFYGVDNLWRFQTSSLKP